MVDFATTALPLIEAGIKVVAGSVDSVEETATLKQGLHVGFPMYAGLDVHAVHESTGAFIQDDEQRTILHATSFLVTPDGLVSDALYSTGPIGRMTPADVLRKVAFVKRMG